jgi:hypothetical protein
VLPSITVTGKGEIHSQPDMARVNIGVVTQEITAAEALNKNTEAGEDRLRLPSSQRLGFERMFEAAQTVLHGLVRSRSGYGGDTVTVVFVGT